MGVRELVNNELQGIKVMRFIFLSLLFISMLGCVSVGPTSSPQFQNLLQSSIPSGSGTIGFYGPCVWIPNTRGFSSPDSRFFLGGDYEKMFTGVLAATEIYIFILQWDNQRETFNIIKRFPLKEKIDISYDSYGRNARVSMQWNDYSTDSFSIYNQSVTFVDLQSTEKFFQYLTSINNSN